MKVLDLNLLLYAINRDSAFHAKAKKWLEQTLNGEDSVAFPWTVILGFLRISTHPGIFPTPLRSEDAVGIVDGWLARPTVRILETGKEHWQVLKILLAETGTAGNLTTDAHLAALAIENGAELQSTDADFGRFKHLSWTNPLQQ